MSADRGSGAFPTERAPGHPFTIGNSTIKHRLFYVFRNNLFIATGTDVHTLLLKYLAYFIYFCYYQIALVCGYVFGFYLVSNHGMHRHAHINLGSYA